MLKLLFLPSVEEKLVDVLGWEKPPQVVGGCLKKYFRIFVWWVFVWCDMTDCFKDAQGDSGNFFMLVHIKDTEKFKSNIKCNGTKFNVTLKVKFITVLNVMNVCP